MLLHVQCLCSLKPLLHGVLDLSVSLDPLSLGQGKDRYEWIIYVDSLVWKLKVIPSHLQLPPSKCHIAELPFLVSLLRGLISAFTDTFPLWSSLSFINSLSSVPGMIPLPPLFQPFTPLFCCLCSTSGSVSFVSPSSPIFLLLRWFESSFKIAPCKQKHWR